MIRAYISFGKWKGYEVFNHEYLSKAIPDEELREKIVLQMQLPLEFIRPSVNGKIHALLFVWHKNKSYLIYLKYIYGVDAVKRAGHMAGAIVTEGYTLINNYLKILDDLILWGSKYVRTGEIITPKYEDKAIEQILWYYSPFQVDAFTPKSALIIIDSEEQLEEGLGLLPHTMLHKQYNKIFICQQKDIRGEVKQLFIDHLPYDSIQEDIKNRKEEENKKTRCWEQKINDCKSLKVLNSIEEDISSYNTSSIKEFYAEIVVKKNWLIGLIFEKRKLLKEVNVLEKEYTRIQDAIVHINSHDENDNIKRKIENLSSFKFKKISTYEIDQKRKELHRLLNEKMTQLSDKAQQFKIVKNLFNILRELSESEESNDWGKARTIIEGIEVQNYLLHSPYKEIREFVEQNSKKITHIVAQKQMDIIFITIEDKLKPLTESNKRKILELLNKEKENIPTDLLSEFEKRAEPILRDIVRFNNLKTEDQQQELKKTDFPQDQSNKQPSTPSESLETTGSGKPKPAANSENEKKKIIHNEILS